MYYLRFERLSSRYLAAHHPRSCNRRLFLAGPNNIWNSFHSFSFFALRKEDERVRKESKKTM